MRSAKFFHLSNYFCMQFVSVAFLMVIGMILSPQIVAAELPVPQHIDKQMRCPVCGMYPSRYPQWRVQLIYADRSLRAFDSPVDLLQYLENRSRYEKGQPALELLPKIAAIYVSDFTQGAWVEVRQAWVVRGSKIRGPMNGPDYPAFASETAAQSFAAQQGGQALRLTSLVSLDFQNEVAGKATGPSPQGHAQGKVDTANHESHDEHDGHHH